jgi:translation initiation factor IF-3
VRVIGANGKQIGVLTIQKALAEANKAGLDLIEIAPKAKPPVAKIADFGKFRYQEEKRLKKQKKGSKGSELKEVRFSPFIAEHDYKVRYDRIREFLEEGNKIRVVVVFKGRHMGSKQFGYDLLKKIVDKLGETISVDMEPKFFGRHLAMVISPTNKKSTKSSTSRT